MIKEKKHYIWLFLIISIVGVGYIIVHRIEKGWVESEGRTTQQIERIDSVIEREEEVWRSIQMLLEHRTIEGITAIDIIEGQIETDQHMRYLVTFQVLGVNEEEEIDLYDYYMVMQEDENKQLYMLPFGIEILESKQNDMKKDIARSVLKVANGWGLPKAKINGRWIDSGDHSVNVGNNATRKYIYSVQQIITFMSDYMSDWLKAVEVEDMSFIMDYYKDGSQFQQIQSERLKKINEQKMRIEIYDLEVIDIICTQEDKIFEVTIQGNLRVYSDDKIKIMSNNYVYTLEKNNGTFFVLDEKIIKKQ